MKGEGKNFELAECAMRRGVSVRAYGGADEETMGDTVSEGTGVFSKKAKAAGATRFSIVTGGRAVEEGTDFNTILRPGYPA